MPVLEVKYVATEPKWPYVAFIGEIKRNVWTHFCSKNFVPYIFHVPENGISGKREPGMVGFSVDRASLDGFIEFLKEEFKALDYDLMFPIGWKGADN